MTYGEAVMFQKSTMRMQNGRWVSDPLPEYVKLSEKEAFEYYGEKLNAYWLEQVEPSIEKRSETSALKILSRRVEKLTAKLQTAQDEIAALKGKEAQKLADIKRIAKRALDAKTMGAKDTNFRSIVKRIGNP